MHYILEPEVAGGLGPNTVIDNSVYPPVVKKLHYQLDGWLGDDLLESFPCFIVSENMRAIIEKGKATGCSFESVEISVSEQFNELYDKRQLPKFWWLRIDGKAGHDDFGISSGNSLVVSKRILSFMKEGNLENCDVEEFSD